jgi:hypothetical protein
VPKSKFFKAGGTMSFAEKRGSEQDMSRSKFPQTASQTKRNAPERFEKKNADLLPVRFNNSIWQSVCLTIVCGINPCGLCSCPALNQRNRLIFRIFGQRTTTYIVLLTDSFAQPF